MLVTEFGILMEVKELQPEKAAYPMLVTELGISIDLKVQPLYLLLVDYQYHRI